MYRAFALLILMGLGFGLGLNLGTSPEDVERIMASPAYQQELARRMAQ